MSQETASVFSSSLFAGKTILVTGASSGIGQAIALAFLHHGGRVIGLTSRQERADALNRQGIVGRVCDVRSDGDAASILEELDSLDVLVTGAGVARRVEEYQWDVFQDVMQVNLFGTARFAFGARALLARTNGSIVTIASMLSTFGDKLVPSYAASKGAVTQLTKSLAIEYAAEGIRVNAIAPGWIETAMTQSLVDDPDAGPAIAGRTAMKRWGRPEEVANGAIFLASSAASYMTGSTLTIDGGYSIT